MKTFQLILLAGLVFGSISAPTSAQDSLDSDLLKNLDDDLLEGLEGLPDIDLGDQKPDPPTDTPGEVKPEQRPADITITSDNPLLQLSEKMNQSKKRIAKSQLAADTQKLQTEILSDLDVLIEQVTQQCEECKGGGAKPKEGSSDPKQEPGSPKKGEGGGSESQATNPKESTNRVGSASETEVKRRQVDSMLREIWGELPDRVRMRMQDAAVEQVLPKYEKLIEEYYKRLAEERRLRP